jgi:hypothetical protein
VSIFFGHQHAKVTVCDCIIVARHFELLVITTSSINQGVQTVDDRLKKNLPPSVLVLRTAQV